MGGICIRRAGRTARRPLPETDGGDHAESHAKQTYRNHCRRRGAGRGFSGTGRLRRIERRPGDLGRSEENTSELQSLMRTSYAVFCLKKKTKHTNFAQHKLKE